MKKLLLISAIIGIALMAWGVLAFNTKINPLSAHKLRVATSIPTNWWTDGLVGYWNFDGQNTTTTSGTDAGTKDVSENGNWGTFNGGVKPAGGISGQALSFDGSDDYAQVASTPQVDYTGDFTIELWVYPRSFINPNSNCVGDYRSYLTSQTYSDAFHTIKIVAIILNKFQFWVRDTTIKSVTTNALSVNQWYHLVGVRSGNSIIFYNNGASVGTADITGLSLANISDNPFWIGAGDTFSCSNNNFNGLIDEVRIYSRALSAEEIMNHYQQTRRNLRI